MRLLEAIRLALNTIRVQKLKSFFTALGVCIGVMFLITVVSIVDGMGKYMEEDLVGKIIGINTFELRNRPNITIGDVDNATWDEYRKRRRIMESDVPPVVAALPEGVKWAMSSSDHLKLESAYSRPRSADVVAIDGDWLDIKKLDAATGRRFTQQELTYGELVVILGPDLSKRLFPNIDPIGHQVKMGGLPYTIIGIGESQGSVFGISLDNYVIAPFKAPVHRLLNRQPKVIDAISVQSPNAGTLIEAQEAVRAVMRARHKLRPGQKDDFTVETPDTALEFWNKLKKYLVLAGVALPAIGLVVGSIVIMNIMLVAVAERTREIGIRKALGARRSDILTQFLIESATLSTVGALMGIALGALLAMVISAATPLPTSIAPWSVIVGVVVGAGVGIISGVYPASRASRLDPILALRQE
jgi:putative ABC transport system permease protein